MLPSLSGQALHGARTTAYDKAGHLCPKLTLKQARAKYVADVEMGNGIDDCAADGSFGGPPGSRDRPPAPSLLIGGFLGPSGFKEARGCCRRARYG